MIDEKCSEKNQENLTKIYEKFNVKTQGNLIKNER